MKEEYLQFIKDFSSISISKICRELEIDRSCVMRGKSSEAKTKMLYEELKNQLEELLKEKSDD